MDKPHGRAARTAELDVLIHRWVTEYPDLYEQRVVRQLVPAGDCLLWPKSVNTTGYGQIQLPKELGVIQVFPKAAPRPPIVVVHRVRWIAERGPILFGHVCDHHGENGCGVKRCANPDHLRVITQGENIRASLPDTCPNGHPRNAETQRKSGRCIPCHREQSLAQRRLVREAAARLGMTGVEYEKKYGKSAATARRFLGE
jgi:hypothetical protein